jgi:hypothetical protein
MIDRQSSGLVVLALAAIGLVPSGGSVALAAWSASGGSTTTEDSHTGHDIQSLVQCGYSGYMEGADLGVEATWDALTFGHCTGAAPTSSAVADAINTVYVEWSDSNGGDGTATFDAVCQGWIGGEGRSSVNNGSTYSFYAECEITHVIIHSWNGITFSQVLDTDPDFYNATGLSDIDEYTVNPAEATTIYTTLNGNGYVAYAGRASAPCIRLELTVHADVNDSTGTNPNGNPDPSHFEVSSHFSQSTNPASWSITANAQMTKRP